MNAYLLVLFYLIAIVWLLLLSFIVYKKFITSFPYLEENKPDINEFVYIKLLIGNNEEKVVPVVVYLVIYII